MIEDKKAKSYFALDEKYAQEKLLKNSSYNPSEQTGFFKSNRISKFHPQPKSWQYDLPDRENINEFNPRAFWLREKTDNYIELPRFYPYWWWIIFLTGVGATWFSYLNVNLTIETYMSIDLEDGLDIFLSIFDSFMTLFVVTSNCLLLRIFFLHPREIPIRFNRNKQKVYVYQFNWKYNPFVRWKTEVKVYDWQNIQAVITETQEGRFEDGGYSLMCLVCNPGTTEVIDKFVISSVTHSIKAHSETWNYCCRFMLGMHVPNEPVCQGNPTTSLSRAKIDKLIKWPKDIDLESKS